MKDSHFDDLEVGQRFTTPGITLNEAQIIDFALQFDPQPFHMDVEAARSSPYGGLIASGLHSLAIACRLVQHAKPWGTNARGSPGIDALRWLKPVRPGDTLHVESEVRDKRPSRSRADRGTVLLHHAVVNQAGETVMTYSINELVARHPGAGAIPGGS